MLFEYHSNIFHFVTFTCSNGLPDQAIRWLQELDFFHPANLNLNYKIRCIKITFISYKIETVFILQRLTN